MTDARLPTRSLTFIARSCLAQSQSCAVDHRAQLQGQMRVKCLYQGQLHGSRRGRGKKKKKHSPFTSLAWIFPAGLGFEVETFSLESCLSSLNLTTRKSRGDEYWQAVFFWCILIRLDLCNIENVVRFVTLSWSTPSHIDIAQLPAVIWKHWFFYVNNQWPSSSLRWPCVPLQDLPVVMKSPNETASAQPLSPGPPRLTSCLLEGGLNISWDLGVGWGGLAGACCESKLPCEVPLTSLHWKGGPCPSLSLLWCQLCFFLLFFLLFPLMDKFIFEIWATSNVNIF